MQVVVVQPNVVWENKAANHDNVRALLNAQKIENDALIILPEMFDSGFSMNIHATAQSKDRESEAFLRQLARETKAAVLGGVVGPIIDGQASNEAIAFAPDGSELVRYQKMQAFTPLREDVHYGTGDRNQMFSWQGMKISPFVCYDLRFPEIFRPVARDGAMLFIVIASWPSVRSEHWVRLLQARAIENQAFTVGVNRCGSDPNFSYDGRSTAFDPLGISLMELDATEQVAMLHLDSSQVSDWRAKFPALNDMRMI